MILNLKWFAFGITAFVCMPVVVLMSQALTTDFSLWWYSWETVLPDYVSNSLQLVLGVGVGVLALGVPSAWLIARYRFMGHAWLSWALLLPLAMPAYIIAYTYTGLLDVSGPIQSWLREFLGLAYGDYWFWQVRSVSGAIAMLTLVLYPYLYLTLRASLMEQSDVAGDVARTLGSGPWSVFMRVRLPLARPAVVTGLSLALMEVLADYGTVQYFGIPTFTTGIFRSFYAYGDVANAAQLALVLLGFVMLLVLLERQSRTRIGFNFQQDMGQRMRPKTLNGWRSMLAFVCCVLPVLFGFTIPVLQLLWWVVFDAQIDPLSFLSLAWNSVYLAGLAAFLAVVIALILGYAARSDASPRLNKAIILAGLGYAVPGVLTALGVMMTLVWFDHRLIESFQFIGLASPGLLLSGSIVALLIAYSVRFLAVALGTVQPGLANISKTTDDAGRSLGSTGSQVLIKLHVPLMKASVLTALLIVFVDVLKELPATLMLRPFDFNTLAVRAFELASDEQLTQAAPASVMIVLVGLLPVLLLNRAIASPQTESQ